MTPIINIIFAPLTSNIVILSIIFRLAMGVASYALKKRLRKKPQASRQTVGLEGVRGDAVACSAGRLCVYGAGVVIALPP